MAPSMQDTAHRLRLAREMTCLDVERICHEAGIPRRLLDQYERGMLPVAPDHLQALARSLDVPRAWLEHNA